MHNIKKIIEKNIFIIYIFKNADDYFRISDWFENYLCFIFALNLHPNTYLRLRLKPTHKDHMRIKTCGRACLDPSHRPGNYCVLYLHDINLLNVCLPLKNKKIYQSNLPNSLRNNNLYEIMSRLQIRCKKKNTLTLY